MEIGKLIHFLYDMGEYVVGFSVEVLDFMSANIPVLNVTIGAVIFGAGIALYLGYQLTTWAFNLVT